MHSLFDANGDLIGTYKTHRGAMMAVCKRKHKLWEIFDNRKDKESNLVWSIKGATEEADNS